MDSLNSCLEVHSPRLTPAAIDDARRPKGARLGLQRRQKGIWPFRSRSEWDPRTGYARSHTRNSKSWWQLLLPSRQRQSTAAFDEATGGEADASLLSGYASAAAANGERFGMSELLKHREYLGSVKYCGKERMYHGTMQNVCGLVLYDARDLDGLQSAFEETSTTTSMPARAKAATQGAVCRWTGARMLATAATARPTHPTPGRAGDDMAGCASRGPSSIASEATQPEETTWPPLGT